MIQRNIQRNIMQIRKFKSFFLRILDILLKSPKREAKKKIFRNSTGDKKKKLANDPIQKRSLILQNTWNNNHQTMAKWTRTRAFERPLKRDIENQICFWTVFDKGPGMFEFEGHGSGESYKLIYDTILRK